MRQFALCLVVSFAIALPIFLLTDRSAATIESDEVVIIGDTETFVDGIATITVKPAMLVLHH